jgi:NADPH:quinone reductase-like Zn-dependent oxidoreductase
MKAARFDKYGGIEVLQIVAVPVPEPSHGEALVKVKATSINPGEAKIREGLLHAMWPATFPSGEGSDLAGITADGRSESRIALVTFTSPRHRKPETG